MELLSAEEQQHRLEAVEGGIRALVSRVPGLGELIAGWDAYNRSRFELYVRNFLASLQEQVDDLKQLLSDEWLKTAEGQRFTRKVVDAALDAQLEEKHQLFANSFVNGIQNKALSEVEKSLFVDILRKLSLNALLVLGEMHNLFAKDVVPSTGSASRTTGDPGISTRHLVQELNGSFHPYQIESALEELKSMGLFSIYSAWRYDAHDKKFREDSQFSPGSGSVFYTEFTARFAAFIRSRHST